jgi:hypothetical protein
MFERIRRILFAVSTRTRAARVRAMDVVDLALAPRTSTGSVRSVCLALGPYRNLTTLIASVLFLHPHAQVLNHAGKRIYKNPLVDFVSAYSDRRFDNFLRFALRISGTGYRGQLGGSITASHAFDAQHPMRSIFERSGLDVDGREVHALFWKESLRTSNLLRRTNVDLGAVFARNTRLRFLQPIRNPIDCAISNVKTHHAVLFVGLAANPTIEDVLRAVMRELAWYAELREANPERFFHFFEYEQPREMLTRLAEFLELEAEPTWLDNAVDAMKVKPGYDHDPELVAVLHEEVAARFGRWPDLAAGLLRFVDPV